MTIINDVKESLTINSDNSSFDSELLPILMGVLATASQLGVNEFDGVIITEETEWPVFDDVNVKNAVVPWVTLKIKMVFDPTPSDAISKAYNVSLSGLEQLILILKSEEV